VRVLGIDEAGRGCVFGPLVVAGFLVEHADDDTLRAAGAADSKALTAKRRDLARAALGALGTAFVRAIEPDAIDAGNLNAHEEAAIVSIVREARPDVIFVDALGHPSTTARTIERLAAEVAPIRARWTMEPKADATYPVVGAASIFAKTTRDARLDAERARFGELGSGYPSDPETKAWIAAWARTGKPWPPFVRTRWATIGALAQGSLLG
jgi:ribonuclease HII